MLVKRVLCSSTLRGFSSLSSHTLKVGDTLKDTRTFSSEDVLEYSKPGAIYVSQSLHFRLPVYIGDKIVAEIQAVTLRGNNNKYIAKLLTKCFKNGEVLVLDGEATAILPSLEVEKAYSVQ